MSRGACIMLGITLVILASGFVGVAWFTSGLEGMRASTIGAAILAVFSGVGAIACLVPASRPVTLRLVGGTVCLTCLGYLTEMLISGPLLGRSRADQSLVNSFLAFSAFGLPAGYVAFKGRYPIWAKYSSIFKSTQPPIPDTPQSDSSIQPSQP